MEETKHDPGAASRPLPGRIKARPEDFVVDEIPAYLPSGDGSHLYLHVKKTNRNTDDVVRDLARALGVDRRDVGVAGMKDKVGVTTQWISVPARDAAFDAKLDGLALDGVEILRHARHGNKLRTGHLRGNRFTIVVRAVDPTRLAEIADAFERVDREGVPNAFGAQRFGRDADNHLRARDWLTGKSRAPQDARLRRLHFSALQSAIFNAVLDARKIDGTWNIPVLGDLLQKEALPSSDTDPTQALRGGGIFVCTDVQEDRARALRGEVCPTGPILGDKMRSPEGDALALEQRIAAPFIEGIDLHRARSLGEGTRRALRLRVTELSHELLASSVDEAVSSEHRAVESAIKVRFVLPKGAYATTVLESVFTLIDAAPHHAEREADHASADTKAEEE